MEAPFRKLKLMSIVFEINLVYSVVFVYLYTIDMEAPFWKLTLMFEVFKNQILYTCKLRILVYHQYGSPFLEVKIDV